MIFIITKDFLFCYFIYINVLFFFSHTSNSSLVLSHVSTQPHADVLVMFFLLTRENKCVTIRNMSVF